MLYHIESGQRVSEFDLRERHPNTSFANTISAEDLASLGYVKLEHPALPLCDASHIVQDIGQEEIDGKWYIKYTTRAKSIDEIATLEEVLRSNRNTLLSASDWTQLPDATVDKPAWAVYRQELRDITSRPEWPFDVQWPDAP